jgi:hypothetical protein
MGGFFITNKPDAVETARAFFADKPLRFVAQRSTGGVTVLHWAKLKATLAPAVHEAADGWILGVGTFFHGDRFGAACLPELWEASRTDPRVFGEVGGHFAFVFERGGKIFVVTDKTGTYNVHVARYGESFFLSTSMFSLAECLPRLTPGRQEALEFVNYEMTLGGHTLFEEIRHADSGVIIECKPSLPAKTYYVPRDERVTFDELVGRYEQYFRRLGNTGFVPCCDLSAGYDSRTVAALLAHAGVAVDYNTNQNVRDPNDQLIAQQVAAFLQRPVKVYRNRARELDQKKLVEECSSIMELSRDIHGAAFMPVYFREKAADFPMIIGGWNGELLRDKFAGPGSLDELVRSFYVSPYIWLRGSVYTEYRERLVLKFEDRLRELGETDIKKGCEKIYCFEKLRFWGGSRITIANQYCHHLHPLLDHTLARHVFDFPLAEKAGGALQKRLIALVPGLDAIPINPPAVPSDPKLRVVHFLRTRLHMPMPEDLPPEGRRLWYRLRARGRYHAPELLARATQTPMAAALAHFIRLPMSHLAESALLGRFATVTRALERYESKIHGM